MNQAPAIMDHGRISKFHARLIFEEAGGLLTDPTPKTRMNPRNPAGARHQGSRI